MRILALHGYMQNATMMKKKMEKLFGSTVTSIVCPEGSYMPIPSNNEQYGWWPLPSKNMFNKPHTYSNMNDFLEPFKELAKIQSEFDIIIGFSQGAVAATILLDQGIIDAHLIVLISGSDIMDANFIPIKSITTKALAVVGETDSLCSLSDTEALLRHYKKHSIVTHKHGHIIPTSKSIRDAIRHACIME